MPSSPAKAGGIGIPENIHYVFFGHTELFVGAKLTQKDWILLSYFAKHGGEFGGFVVGVAAIDDVVVRQGIAEPSVNVSTPIKTCHHNERIRRDGANLGDQSSIGIFEFDKGYITRFCKEVVDNMGIIFVAIGKG